jgi:hypothetical protein
MQSDFYNTPAETFPTFSLVLASLMSLPAAIGRSDSLESASANAGLHMEHKYYETAPNASVTEQQGALSEFAEKLLAETEDSPQEVRDVLNKHFWELV